MGHIRCPRDFRLWLKVKPKPKPTWNVVDDVVHGLFDALDGGIKQSLHGVEWETDHALRRPANVLVVELVDRRLYLTALSTTSHAPTQSIDQRVPKVCRHNTHTHTHTHTRLMALCPGLPGWGGTRKEKSTLILLKQETVSGSGIRWATRKSASRSRQITMPAPHHSVAV